MNFDVVGVGYSAVDYLGIVPNYPPAADEKTELLELSMQGGGPTATALVALSRLGLKTSFIGKVGDDEFGNFMVLQLQKEGVDTSGVVMEKGARSAFAFIVVEKGTGKRTILWTPPTTSPLRPDEVKRQQVSSAKMLYIDGITIDAALDSAKWAKETGITVFLDADTLNPQSEELIKLSDVAIASEQFAKAFTKSYDPVEASKRLQKFGPNITGVTLGTRGSVCVMGDRVYKHPAFMVNAVDTTGAGDVFHGAFAYGLLQAWNLQRIMAFAAAVAALKCTKLGGRPGIPTLNQALEFLEGKPPTYS
jgi:ribokinase